MGNDINDRVETACLCACACTLAYYLAVLYIFIIRTFAIAVLVTLRELLDGIHF